MLQSFSGYFVCNSDCYISEKHLKPPYRSSPFGGLEWTVVFLAKWGTSNMSSGSPSGWLEMSCLAQKQSKFWAATSVISYVGQWWQKGSNDWDEFPSSSVCHAGCLWWNSRNLGISANAFPFFKKLGSRKGTAWVVSMWRWNLHGKCQPSWLCTSRGIVCWEQQE